MLGLGVVGTVKRRYRKHFLYLDGLGIRELARDGKDLLILAGPTMALDGTMRMYRLRDAAGLADDSLTGPEDGRLTRALRPPRRRRRRLCRRLRAHHLARASRLWSSSTTVLRRPVARPQARVYADVFWLHA